MEIITVSISPDNKNRTFNDIRQILNQNGGKIVGEGGVQWMFDRKGVITIPADNKPKEELELLIIEAGGDDIRWNENTIEVYTKPEDLENVKKTLEEKSLKIEGTSLILVAKEEIILNEKDKEKAQKLFEAIDENDAIQDIYSNLKN